MTVAKVCVMTATKLGVSDVSKQLDSAICHVQAEVCPADSAYNTSVQAQQGQGLV